MREQHMRLEDMEIDIFIIAVTPPLLSILVHETINLRIIDYSSLLYLKRYNFNAKCRKHAF
jgi:hypothetical protein